MVLEGAVVGLAGAQQGDLSRLPHQPDVVDGAEARFADGGVGVLPGDGADGEQRPGRPGPPVSRASTARGGSSSSGRPKRARRASSTAGRLTISPPIFTKRFSRPANTRLPCGVLAHQVAGAVPGVALRTPRTAGARPRPGSRRRRWGRAPGACRSPRGATRCPLSRSTTAVARDGRGRPMVPRAGDCLPVAGDHRGALGDAVALQDRACPASDGDGGEQGLRALLRAGDDEAQGASAPDPGPPARCRPGRWACPPGGWPRRLSMCRASTPPSVGTGW